ncbi:F-box At5g07610-like [Olea europaea subsp. europaea]|uniref:F-box At5g07610-like n=1 Tax=Olea europaea subsp. europaea TaxID=158383 RepID=A0A8S0QLV1_OLEEU|nr:F-box At5g07610-like [Olea europaea subsp. europaea]
MKIKIKLIRTAEQATSAQVVASIDLLTEILLRFPIKSLIRFKLVSKDWHYFITNPKFCHLRNPNPNPALGLLLPFPNFRISPLFEYVPFSVQNPTNPPLRKLKFTKDSSRISILKSCNGLLLCSSLRALNHNLKYYVYNPTTKRFTTLPKPDQGTGIRKKICASRSQLMPISKKGCIGMVRCTGLVMGPLSLYFVIDEERLETLPMPPIPDGWEGRSNYYIGESCGHLNFIETFGPQIQFDVYEMKRDYSEWFVKYQVDLSPLVSAFPGMIRSYLNPTNWYYYALSIFCLIQGERYGDSFLVLQIPGKAIRYNLVHKTFEKLHDFEGAEVEDSLRFSWTNGFQHIESLCCV